MSPTKPLLELTAGDLMVRSVVVIPERMSVHAAAHLLRQARVSGAPVVDARGRCVGVLSASDFMSIVEQAGYGTREKPKSWPDFHSAWQVLEQTAPAGDDVQRYMTADPVTVSPTTSIGRLARMMVDAHIHRVLVADAEGKPVGIVSSTDVLAAVGRADAEERAGIGTGVGS